MFTIKILSCVTLITLFSCSNERVGHNDIDTHYSLSEGALINNQAHTLSLLVNSISNQALPFTDGLETKLNSDSLATFSDKISNVRIIGLGEQTHGAGSVFTLKVDLIKHLHQKHNFDLFILESGLYDVEKLYQQSKEGQRLKDIAPGNIFYMYANSEEVTPLFDYINEQAKSSNPLKLVGFDSRHTGTLSKKGLVDDLNNAFKAINKANVKPDELHKLSKQIQQVLNGSLDRFTLVDEQLFFEKLDNLVQVFSKANEGFWLRITKGLVAQAKKQWLIEDNRSREMGENVKWWAEQYPDKKIIVWAHTWHLTKEGNEQVNAGQVISEHFKDQYYMVHFTGEKGSYLNYVDMNEQKVAAYEPNSVEWLMGEQSSSPINFIDIANVPLAKNGLKVFANNYQQTLPSNEWNRYFDGIFILKQVTPSSYSLKITH